MRRNVWGADIHYRTDAGSVACKHHTAEQIEREQVQVTCADCQLWLNAHGHGEKTNPAPRALRGHRR